MYKKNCFAYIEKHGGKKCSALVKLECDNCKFYKTRREYEEKVLPLEHKSKKKSGG